MGKKLNSRQRCASNVAGDVAGDKSLATGVHFRFGPCTHAVLIQLQSNCLDCITTQHNTTQCNATQCIVLLCNGAHYLPITGGVASSVAGENVSCWLYCND